ncbi:MAG TPA: kelch repeat-containing protein [Candidatus Baltobacteraceae bacterium]|nr:kelch repeat-containing protein [Candidatus Baltobacteraceae bacterium]
MQIPATLSDREGAAMAYDSGRHVLVLFGGNNSAGVQQDTWTWDASRWSRQFPHSAPSPRTGAAMAYDPASGNIVLFGGDPSSTIGYLNDTWTWNGSRWTLVQTPVAPPPRTRASLEYDPVTGTLILFGGLGTTDFLADTWSWNGTAWRQIATTASPPGRYDASLAYYGPGKQLVLFGGLTMGAALVGDTWTFDGSNWQQVSTVGPTARQGAALEPQSNGTLVLFGGYTNNTLVGLLPHQAIVPGGEALNDTWTWNGTSWSAVALPASSPAARYDMASAYDGAISAPVLMGGCCNNYPSGGFLDDTWSWNGASWDRHDTPGLPQPRSGASFVAASSHGLLLFGGYGGDGFLSDTWVYSAANWSEQSGSGSPPARFAAASAYDSSRGVVVVYGGQGTSPTSCTSSLNPPSNPNHLCDDTWTWNGTWTHALTSTFPSRRSLATMADDPSNGRVILYGGFADLNTLEDTWAWNGQTWTQLQPATTPGPRYGAVSIYDPDLHEPVLFGGEGYDSAGNPIYLSDTWAWNGSTWIDLHPSASPPARYEASMTYDPALGGVLLYGGLSSNGTLSDSWLFAGGTWRRLSASGPPSRDFAALSFDQTSGAAVLFGGSGSDGYLNDTWTR